MEDTKNGFNFKLNDHYAIRNSSYCYMLYDIVNESNLMYINDLNKCFDESIKWLAKHNQTISNDTLKEISKIKEFNTQEQKNVKNTIVQFVNSL